MGDLLDETIAKETFKGKFFEIQTRCVPTNVLDRLVTENEIYKWLNVYSSDPKMDEDEMRQFANTVFQRAKKLFVISVAQRLQPEFLEYLVNTLETTDGHLPLKNDYIKADNDTKDEASKDTNDKKKKKKKKKSKNKGNKTDDNDRKNITKRNQAKYYIQFINRFLPYQDTVRPPDFKEDEFNQEVSSLANLPIRTGERLGEGAHGQVYEINIEPASFTFQGAVAAPGVFALKAMESSREVEARRELTFIQALSDAKVDYSHIVRTHTSFTYFGNHYFVLELATTDLDKFFMKTPPKNTETYRTWLTKQMRGLAGAIDKIHNLEETKVAGYIHDIRPANILVFGEPSDSIL